MLRKRLIGIVVGVIALVSVGVAGLAEAASSSTPPLPTKDSFYKYSGSKPLAKIPPGTVLKKRSVTIVISGDNQPFSALQVLYRTRTELGKPSVTVATVIKPAVPTTSVKLVSYQTFYDALGAQCDPSYTLRGGNPNYSDAQDDAMFMRDYLTAGDYVVDPDYEGEHLDWTAGYESGYDTLDGIRAAESALKAPSSTPVGLTGYSGGSIASEWAAELAPRYAPKLHIVGTAIGGIPVDFAHNLNYINGSSGWSGIIPGTLVALNRAFHTALTPYLSGVRPQARRPGDPRVHQLALRLPSRAQGQPAVQAPVRHPPAHSDVRPDHQQADHGLGPRTSSGADVHARRQCRWDG